MENEDGRGGRSLGKENGCEGVNGVLKILAGSVPLAIAAAVAGIFAVVELSEADRSRLEWDQHTRKAGIYEVILKSLDGFYENAQDPRRKKEEVLRALRLCELHCADEVVRAGNAFLDTVAVGAGASEEEQQRAMAAFRQRLRRDLQPSTALSLEEFRVWGSR